MSGLERWQVIPQRGQLFFGIYLSERLVYFFGFWLFLAPHVSPAVCLSVAGLWIGGVLLSLQILLTPAHRVSATSTPSLVSEILSNSRIEGPEEALTGARVYRLCCRCQVNKMTASCHCKYCDTCVIEQDQHAHLLNTCIGRGNRRLYLIFLIFLALFHAEFAYLSYFAARGICPGSSGVFSMLFCLAYQKFIYFFLFGSSGYLALVGFLQVYISLLIVARESTLFYVRKTGFAPAPSTSQIFHNIIRFIWNGQYKIRLPVKDEETVYFSDEEDEYMEVRKPRTRECHDHTHDHSHHGDDSDTPLINNTSSMSIKASERV